jgi:hypothetical protein
MDLYHLLGVSLAELLTPPIKDGDAYQSMKVFNAEGESGAGIKVRPVGLFTDQAACVGRMAFEVFRGLVQQGRCAKSAQRRVEYYINKSLDSTYARKLAAQAFNDVASEWKVNSPSGRVELTARAFSVDELQDELIKISVRLVVRAKVLDLAS